VITVRKRAFDRRTIRGSVVESQDLPGSRSIEHDEPDRERTAIARPVVVAGTHRPERPQQQLLSDPPLARRSRDLRSRVRVGGVSTAAGEATFGNLYNSLGVNGFFVVSGLLVTNSLLSSPTLKQYVAARALRIVPALWVLLLITVPVVVLPLKQGAHTSSATWSSALEYLVRNMTIVLVTYPIDGAFENLSNTAVNGSIWMLRFEVVCYGVLGLFGWLGIVRWRHSVALFAAVLIVVFLFVDARDLGFFAGRLVRLGSLFFFGAAMALFSDKLAVNAWLG